MQIKLVSKGLVEVSDNGSSVLVAFPHAKLPETEVLTFGPHVSEKVVRRPGEYEFTSIGLQALETKENHIGTAELYNVELGGVDTLFVMNDVGALSKEDWDALDDVEIVVVSLLDKPQGLDKLINKMLPYVVLAIDAESDAEAEKLLGQKPQSANDKFKFTDKDFESEDIATVVHLLK